MTVFAYCRVSSGKQLQGLSMEIQSDEKLLKSIAEKFETTLGKVYSDKGKSAYKGQNLNNEFGKILNDIEIGEIKSGDILVVRHLDRISRAKLTDGLKIFIGMISKGIVIYTTMDGREYRDSSGDVILATLAFDTANEESVRKSYYTLKNAEIRVKQFIDGYREDGKPMNIGVGNNPFYISNENKRIDKHPVLFDAMKDVVDKYLSGYSLAKCCNYLKEKYNHKISVPGLNESFNSKALFGRLEISLNNSNNTSRNYSGVYQPKKNYVLDGYYPSICDEKAYYKIQKIKSSRSYSDSTKKHFSLLSGGRFLFCECGGFLCSINSRNQRKYYRCNSCGYLMPAYTLDLVVLKSCESSFIQRDIDKNSENPQDEIESLKLELDIKEREFIKRTELVYNEPDLFSSLKENLYNDKLEIDEIKTKISKLNIFSNFDIKNKNINYFSSLLDLIESNVESPDIDKKEIHGDLKNIIYRVIVFKDGLVTVDFKNNKSRFYYLPADYNKSTGVRYGLELILVTKENKEKIKSSIPELSFKFFTKKELDDKAYVFSEKDIPAFLLRRFSKNKNIHSAFFKISIKISNCISDRGFIVWKKNIVMDLLDITERQWFSYKKVNLYEGVYNFLTVEYISLKGNFCSVKVIYDKKKPNEDKLLLSLPLKAIEIKNIY